MTYTTFRNPCTEATANVQVMESFIGARQFAQSNPGRIEMEVEADCIDDARAAAFIEYQAAREEYLSSLVGDIY